MNPGRAGNVQLAIAAALVVTIVAACGGAASGRPAASSSPGARATLSPTLEPAPTVTPEPDAATVIGILDEQSAIEFDAVAAFVTEDAGAVLRGTYTSTPQGSYWQIAVDGDAPIELELLELRGKRYVHGPNEIPWFDESGRYAGFDVMHALATVKTWTSVDRTTIDGEPAWTFEATDSPSVYVPGMTADGEVVEPTATVAVSASGAILGVTVVEGWVPAGSGPGDPIQPIALTLTPKPTAAADIPDAEPVWERFTSSRYGYTIGVPSDITRVATEFGDMFTAGGGEFLAVFPEDQPPGITFEDYVQAFLEASEKQGWVPTGSGVVSVNDCEHVMYGFHEKAPDGTEMEIRFVLVFVDGVGYQLAGSALPEHEQALDDLMPLYACTFHAPA